MTSGVQPLNRFGSAEPSLWLWLTLFYGLRHIPYLMPIARQMLGDWTALEANAYFLPSSLVSLLLFYTWFNRIPEAGSLWRFIWRWGRWLLIAAYLWALGVLLWLNWSVMLRSDHRYFEALLVLAAIDVTSLAYLLLSQQIRSVFSEFPAPVDVASQREADRLKAKARQQLVRDARINALIANTPEQAAIEAHWRAEVVKLPESALPWLELSVLAYQCGQFEQALCLMQQAHDCEPQNALVLRNLCELLRQKKRLSRAIEYGEQAVYLAPKDEIARINLAQALVDDGKLDRALTEYHRVLDLNPHHVHTWMTLAALLLQQDRKADAGAALDAVLLLEPENVQAKILKSNLSA